MEAAREQADGAELYEDPFGDEVVLTELEAAQGVEMFANPDDVIPATALVEGSAGRETFVGERSDLIGTQRMRLGGEPLRSLTTCEA